MPVEELYQEIILDHYKHPHGRGLREPFDADSVQVNPTCGDEIRLRVRLRDDVVGDVSYDAVGCSISQASASVLHDLVVGATVADALARSDSFTALVAGRGGPADEDVLGDAIAFAGVAQYPARVKCALLPWMAFRDAAARALTAAAYSGGDR